MSAIDGGAAFPREDYQTDHAPGQRGMSLRDYIAVHVLQAVVTSARLDGIELGHPDHEAITAYEWADAMLKAREAK